MGGGARLVFGAPRKENDETLNGPFRSLRQRARTLPRIKNEIFRKPVHPPSEKIKCGSSFSLWKTFFGDDGLCVIWILPDGYYIAQLILCAAGYADDVYPYCVSRYFHVTLFSLISGRRHRPVRKWNRFAHRLQPMPHQRLVPLRPLPPPPLRLATTTTTAVAVTCCCNNSNSVAAANRITTTSRKSKCCASITTNWRKWCPEAHPPHLIRPPSIRFTYPAYPPWQLEAGPELWHPISAIIIGTWRAISSVG